MPNLISLVGNTYGELTVIEKAPPRKKKTFWLCRCSCGKSVEVTGASLKSGNTISCGHVALFTRSSHNYSYYPEYDAWTAMWQRCTNEKNPRYKHYGARGIMVCRRWETFENFFEDMGMRPGPRYSIDRINNDGDYEPDNCRWATVSQQNYNRRQKA